MVTDGTRGEGRTLVSGSGGQHSNPLSYGGMRHPKIIMAASEQQGARLTQGRTPTAPIASGRTPTLTTAPVLAEAFR